ncbi:MAG: hypothetical protein JW804_05305 [Sedimentisphaerales bacterium]|nr:hypothetical protein [Sedimentisphaerales bacterium]
MQKGRYVLVLGLIIITASGVCAQPPSGNQELFSPTAALAFHQIAKDLTSAGSEKTQISDSEAKQAMIFFTAAAQLDNQANYIFEDMLLLACNDSATLPVENTSSESIADANNVNAYIKNKGNSKLVQILLAQYVNNQSDLTVCRKAIQYLLSKCDTREEKEVLLNQLYRQFENKNEPLASELAASFGILAAERADFENAANMYLTAINKNRYNRLAFEKLAELTAEKLNTAIYLEQLRFYLRENPLSLQAALVFAQSTQQGELFQTATDAYQYCADLFTYLYPNQPLPQYIYLPHALCAYNTERNPHIAMRIAEKKRKTDVLDIMLETVVAKAAAKTGDIEKANMLFAATENKALLRYRENPSQQRNITQQLGWFYCFGKTDPAKAIDWTNKAYAAEPNSSAAAALLAYAFILNDQPDLAQAFVDNYEPSQILNLAKAHIQLANSEKDAALETLRSIIHAAPETLEAEKAREKINELGSEYIPETEPSLTRTLLESTFENQIVPYFLVPNEIFEYQVKIRGDKFYYGQDFEASLIITNRSNEDIIISENALLQGNIRIDASVRGDLITTIDKLILKKIQPTEHIQPNSSLLIPINLATGRLKNILTRYPQANIEIELTAYLDPVTLADGSVGNRLEDIKPYTNTINRPAMELNPQFLRNRMNSLKRRMQSHKTAELFAGLLMEESIMANQEPLYKFVYADWMPDILKSGLVYNLTTDNWPSRVYTMSSMLPLPLDFELIEAVSQNLNDEYWPARMMALYLLAQNRNSAFDKVLDHMAQYDQNKIVRTMAVALGGKKPQKQP